MGKRAAERSAACATCGKTFSRSDTLLRHEKSHHATEDRGPIHRVTNGTFRACCSCAQARSRCSGGSPCGRCKTRNIECVYPNKRRKGITNEDEGQITLSTMDMSSNHRNDNSKPPQHYPGQFHQFVFASSLDPPYAGAEQPRLDRVNSTPEVPHMEQMQLRPQAAGHTPSNLGPVGTPSVQQFSSIDASLQGMASIPRSVHSQEQYSNTSVPMDYQHTFNHSQTPYGANEMYDDTLNLNWIPLSIYPSPYGEMEQDFSFLLPSMSDTASMGNQFDHLAFETSFPAIGRGAHAPKIHSSPDYHPAASISGLMQSPASTGSDNVASTSVTYDHPDHSVSRKRRRKSSYVPTGFPQHKEGQRDFAFPDMSLLTNPSNREMCSEVKYNSIFAAFQQLCVNSQRWNSFSSPALPGLSALNACINLYFEHLHPTFPLIHAPTFESNSDWLTCLATAAIGSTFTTIPNSADAREAFQEFLRRAVLVTADDHGEDFRNINLAQSRVLALIGLTQSDNEQLRSRVPQAHADIARWCLESGILQLTSLDEEVRSGENAELAWIRWISQESLRRIGYFIWYLDCALGYIGNARPLCNMDDARAPLPCPEILWNASSAQEWLSHQQEIPQTPSLCAALENMYSKKKIDSGLSEMAQILLIHALYSRTWEVGTHIKQPLSEWKATGNSTGFLNTPSKDNFWLPLYPLYANWRNSACDCLDFLHWQAAATIGRNSGAEHHGVLHLHLARVILLTPFQEIQDLLFFLINHRVSDLSKASFYVHDGSYQPRNPAKLPQIRKITRRWLCEDQHKARLAMIHAGSVFWHVRRWSKNSFFEPLAIYLASIVLWTYGSYKSAALERGAASGNGSSSINPKQHYSHPKTRADEVQAEPGTDHNIQPTRVERAAQEYASSKSHSSRSRSARNASTASNSPIHSRSIPSGSPAQGLHAYTESASIQPTPASSSDDDSGDEDDEQPTFIHLDRPCDDEIVQHFVRNGHNMSGYMSNVGDICQTPQKVLLEGAKILRTKLACWGVSREYHDILMRLAEIRKDKAGDRKGKNKGKGRGNGIAEKEGELRS